MEDSFFKRAPISFERCHSVKNIAHYKKLRMFYEVFLEVFFEVFLEVVLFKASKLIQYMLKRLLR